MKFFSKLCLGAAFIAFSLPMMAQTASWRKGALYRLQATTSGRVLDVTGTTAITASTDAQRTQQYWTIAPLSGSWRILNPFTQQALRHNGLFLALGESEDAPTHVVTVANGGDGGGALVETYGADIGGNGAVVDF